MAQKVTGIIKLQINAAKATASPPVGPALGQHGVNIAAFIKEFNARTQDMAGYKIPVVITVRRPQLHLYHQDPSDPPADYEGNRSGEGLRRSQQDQGWHHHQGSDHRDRQDQDARPELPHSGGC